MLRTKTEPGWPLGGKVHEGLFSECTPAQTLGSLLATDLEPGSPAAPKPRDTSMHVILCFCSHVVRLEPPTASAVGCSDKVALT